MRLRSSHSMQNVSSPSASSKVGSLTRRAQRQNGETSRKRGNIVKDLITLAKSRSGESLTDH